MSEVHKINHVLYLDHYRLELTFAGGEHRIVDLGYLLDRHIFKPLQDPAYFRQFCLDDEMCTLVWPNGADICPDHLYNISVPVAAKKAL